MSEHKSVKICVARRLKTCQDLQASMDTMNLFGKVVVAEGFLVSNSGISADNLAWNRINQLLFSSDFVYKLQTYVSFCGNGWFVRLLVIFFVYNFRYLKQKDLAGNNNLVEVRLHKIS